MDPLTHVLIAVVDASGLVIEVADWDRQEDFERPAADRLVDITARPDIRVGWTFSEGKIYPPEAGETS